MAAKQPPPPGLPPDVDCEKYRKVIPPHSPADLAGLRSSLEAEGFRAHERVVVGILDGERYLIDGFGRKRLCDELGLEVRFEEMAFGTEEDLLNWVKANARKRRQYTRTTLNYFIGERYAREKGAHGVRGPKKDGKTVAIFSDSTATRIATEEACSHQHVKNCEKLYLALEQLTGPLEEVKWAFHHERLKYSKAVVERIVELGAGSDEVQALVGMLRGSAAPLAGKEVREALGIVGREKAGRLRPPDPGKNVAINETAAKENPVDVMGDICTAAVQIAESVENARDLEIILVIYEGSLAQLRGLIKKKKETAV